MGKLTTPDWIKEGYDSPEDYAKSKGKPVKKKKETSQVQSNLSKGRIKEKTFKVRKCPKCEGYNVNVVLSGSDSEQGGGKEWECKNCKWHGKNIEEKELTEDEFMKYLDEKGESVA